MSYAFSAVFGMMTEISMGCLVIDFYADVAQPLPMTTEKWEQLVIEEFSLKKINELIKKLGKEGWEGTGVTYYRGGFNGLYIVLLKRRLE